MRYNCCSDSYFTNSLIPFKVRSIFLTLDIMLLFTMNFVRYAMTGFSTQIFI